MNDTSDKSNSKYVDRKKFNALVISYIESRDEAIYEELHPILTVFIEMLMWKKMGRANNDSRDSRKDYNSIKQNMFLRFFQTLRLYDESKGDPFSYFYKVMNCNLIYGSINEDELIKNNTLVSELSNNDAEYVDGNVRDVLDMFGHVDPDIFKEDEEEYDFNTLFSDLRQYLVGRMDSEYPVRRKLMQFMIECIDDPNFKDNVNKNLYSTFHGEKVSSTRMNKNIFSKLYANKLGKSSQSKYNARFNNIMNTYREQRNIKVT